MRSRMTALAIMNMILTMIIIATKITAGVTSGATSRFKGTGIALYAPPSLYYPQPASTEITLVFPIDIR